MSLIENFRNIFKIQDLRERILYVVGVLCVYRIGTFVTMPGVDASQLAAWKAALQLRPATRPTEQPNLESNALF